MTSGVSRQRGQVFRYTRGIAPDRKAGRVRDNDNSNIRSRRDVRDILNPSPRSGTRDAPGLDAEAIESLELCGGDTLQSSQESSVLAAENDSLISKNTPQKGFSCMTYFLRVECAILLVRY